MRTTRTQHFVVTMTGQGLTRKVAERMIRAGLGSWGYGVGGCNGKAKVRPLVFRVKKRPPLDLSQEV